MPIGRFVSRKMYGLVTSVDCKTKQHASLNFYWAIFFIISFRSLFLAEYSTEILNVCSRSGQNDKFLDLVRLIIDVIAYYDSIRKIQ